jgi:hypothetical protein
MEDMSPMNTTTNNPSSAGSVESMNFPMTGSEVLQRYGRYMTPFERDEVKQFPIVHYMNLTANRKAFILNHNGNVAQPMMA